MKKTIALLLFLTSLICSSQNNQLSKEQIKIEYNKGNYKTIIDAHLKNNANNYDIDKINLVAKCYEKTENLYKALEYLNIAIQISKETNNTISLLDNYINIALVNKKIQKRENYTKAINFLLKALEINKLININDDTKNIIHNNLANCYKRLQQKENSLFHHKKALSIAKANKDSIKIARSYSNIGALYLNINSTEKDLNRLEYYSTEALRYNPKPHYSLFLNLGIASYLKKKYQKAINNHNKAIQIILGKTSYNKFQTIAYEQIKNSNKKGDLLNVLFEKTYAWIKYAEQEKKNKFLEEGLKTIKLADKIIDLLFIEAKEEKTKTYWRQRASKFYFLGVHISHLLNDTETIFYFTEKNKALLLLNNTTLSKLNRTIKIPDSIKNKEVRIRKEIYHLENLLTLENKNKSQNKLFEKKLELDIYFQSLKSKYPNYIKNNKNLAQVLPLKEFQNKIKDTNTCYISYLWNKSENQFDALYGIIITKNSSNSFKIEDLKGFNQRVLKYKTQVSKPITTTNDQKKHQEVAHLLYLDLFPLEIKSKIRNKKLIIIPDNELANIPFEALITNNTTNALLINSNEISYAYSASFLIENNSIHRQAKKSIIGFAPHSFSQLNLPSLPRSINETTTIINNFNGDLFEEKNATKVQFLTNLNNYKIIHLSTHADVSDSINPWIAFKNEKLYLNELYTSKNQAELVVLNACKTSIGDIKEGEGVFSLARGFFYSGSKSVISSLWNVNDKSNTEITLSFYKYLKDGQSKSAALRQAKLDYLDTHSLSEASPYYWSSLILIGDDSALKLTNNSLFYIILSVLLSILLFFILKNNG
ncbi:CHAT domain-containing protein [Psychroserpens sp. NJDZ02]|uniref:CHAT domain-containing protein n=1 Tax=Psychroserpens sp. NJDZ02 TaxID=2570561 RepID=UPI0010A7CC6F|nr:CHAT domain-containing tetratricopeptide repeat protein [Psychroserpens sp. NJDZ02]QCE40400.1 CHAT domain-containing protein [Psychroserpens sp. NJDZ02]